MLLLLLLLLSSEDNLKFSLPEPSEARDKRRCRVVATSSNTSSIVYDFAAFENKQSKVVFMISMSIASEIMGHKWATLEW